jgi:hypothetical protein
MAGRLVCALALLAVACGAAYDTEHQLLSNFFRASRVRDRVAAGQLSSVAFEPHISGSVQDFTITHVVHREDAELVTVAATVRTPEGASTPRTLVIVLEPAPADGGRTSGSRWVITSIR